MGLFDSVLAVCPNCGKHVEFQTKVGLCDLKRYATRSVPLEIATSLHGAAATCQCGTQIQVRHNLPPRVVMEVYLYQPDTYADDNYD